MPAVNLPASQTKDRHSSPIIDDGSSNDPERQLCGAVDAMLADVSRVLQQSASERNAKIRLHGATDAFLRANGIHIAQENEEEDRGNKGSNSSGDAEAALRTQLEHCRDLLRRVDGERRQLRQQYVHLKSEQDQRRAEVEAVHRYSSEAHQRALTLERHLAETRQQRRRLEEQLDAQTQEMMQLRRVLRAMPHDLVASLYSPEAFASASSVTTAASASAGPHTLDASLALVPDRRFEEAFKDKMNSIVYKRRYRRASALHQAASEQLEALRMEQQDPQVVGAQWSFASEGAGSGVVAGTAAALLNGEDARTRGSIDTSAVADTTLGFETTSKQSATNASSAAALASAVFWQSAIDFPFQLPFSTATPQDVLIKSLVYGSQYAEPLTQLREHALRLSSRLKTTQDAGLRTLYLTFNQALQRLGATPAQAQCRSLYERQMDKMQRAHRELLYSLIEQVNQAAMAIPELERAGSGGLPFGGSHGGFGGSATVQRRDVGCSAQETISVEEFRASQLKEQLTKLKLQSLEAAATALKEKEAAAAQYSTARQAALQALQSLKKLTTCLAASVQTQHGTEGVVYDPLEQVKEPLTEEVLDDPRLMTKMAEATDLSLTYVRQITRGRNAAAATPASPPRTRTSLAASARQSSSLACDGDTAREDTYGCINDIHRRNSASEASASASSARPADVLGGKRTTTLRDHRPPPQRRGSTDVSSDRRKSAPPSLNATVRRARSSNNNNASIAVAHRRRTVPQLPAMALTPSAPTTKRGACGRPGRSDAAAALHAPPSMERAGGLSGSSCALPHKPLKGVRKSSANVDGRSPNAATISVIELGFSEDNIRLD